MGKNKESSWGRKVITQIAPHQKVESRAGHAGVGRMELRGGLEYRLI